MKMDSASNKDSIVSTPSKKSKSSQLLNPNYASVRCTQPLPSVIKLRADRQTKQQGGNTEDKITEVTHEHIQIPSSQSQPLLLTNLSYEDHCLNQNNNHNESSKKETSQKSFPETSKQASVKSDAEKLGMFQYMKFQRQEDEDGDAIVEVDDVPPANDGTLTLKQKLKHILHSKPIHVIIIILVLIDSILVVLELLIDFKAINFGEGSPVPGILHGFSIAILSVFMVEISLKIYADYRHFFRHKIEMLDAFVVFVSFAFDVALVFFEDSEVLAALGLLVILRLWRVFRIINGIILTVKVKADEKMHALKDKVALLEERNNEAENTIKNQEQEIKTLRQILQENGIEINESLFPNRKSSQDADQNGVSQLQLSNSDPVSSLSV